MAIGPPIDMKEAKRRIGIHGVADGKERRTGKDDLILCMVCQGASLYQAQAVRLGRYSRSALL